MPLSPPAINSHFLRDNATSGFKLDIKDSVQFIRVQLTINQAKCRPCSTTDNKRLHSA